MNHTTGGALLCGDGDRGTSGFDEIQECMDATNCCLHGLVSGKR